MSDNIALLKNLKEKKDKYQAINTPVPKETQEKKQANAEKWPIREEDNKKNESAEEIEEDDEDNTGGTILQEKPNIKWDDIAGLEYAKEQLIVSVLIPLKFPSIFIGARKAWKGVLLYGPPGTGKTFLAKACATESNAAFFSVSSADIMSKYVGDSEKQVKRIFNRAWKSKHSIIFIDEIDSMVSAWSDNENEATKKVKTEFLTQMDGVSNTNNRPMVLGATNLPWSLDTAIIRRFPRWIYIPLPDESSRWYMVLHALKNEFY